MDQWINPAVLIQADDCIIEAFGVIGLEPRATAANRRAIAPIGQPAVVIGDGTIIGTHATIYWDVRIGRECRFGDKVTVREGCTIGDRCVLGTGVDVQYGVTIADDVRILNEAQIAGGSTIGRGAFIGPGVQTANDPHVMRHDLADYRDRGQVGVHIGEYAFVGLGAILLPGVRIGDRAIVAAGAVVTKDVPAGGEVRGMPARLKEAKPEIEWRERRFVWPAEQCGAGALSAMELERLG